MSAAVAMPASAGRLRVLDVLRGIVQSYLFGRILRGLAIIYIVVTLTFFLVRLMPGNPIDIFIFNLISQYGVTYAEAQAQAAALFSIDLNAPLHLQYLSYLRNLLRGDLGMSILSPGTPVSAMILKFLPWTLFSVGIALLVSFTVGVFLGMLAAYYRDSWIDNILSGLASGLSSIPNYLLGIILVVFLGVQTNLLPIAAMRGSLSPGVEPGWNLHFFLDALYHAALPITTYVLTSFGGWMLTMKSSTVSTLEEDYVHVARAKGLPDSRILTAYVGRNAILPLFTQLTIAVGFVIGGSVLIENIFVYQGVGQLLLSAISRRDYPVMQGVFLIITISVVVANLAADLLYGVLDPRIRVKGGD